MFRTKRAVPAWAVLIAAAVLHGQSGEPPRFEVASVKEHGLAPGVRALARIPALVSPIRISGGRVSTTGTATMLVMAAYQLRDFEVSGTATLPDRAGRDQIYDIEARAPGDGFVAMDQARRMLQSLLADRFQLKFHRESKEVPVYNLVVAAGDGSKLKPGAPEAMSRTTLFPVGSGVIRGQYTNVTISELILRIAPQFDRPLLDRTGLTGGFDFTLEYAPQIDTSVPPDGPPLMMALQQQLGLKVVQAKEAVEKLVVDHLERPSEN